MFRNNVTNGEQISRQTPPPPTYMTSDIVERILAAVPAQIGSVVVSFIGKSMLLAREVRETT